MNTQNLILPAEWSEQSGVMLTWPHAETDWASILPEVDLVYRDITTAISKHECVLIVYHDEAHLAHITKVLDGTSCVTENLVFQCAEYEDTWARDHGPITVMDGTTPLIQDFTFNGWGNKFASENDNRITRTIHEQGAFSNTGIHHLDFVLEGGSIESDGKGTILTTSQCLMNPNRNPGCSRGQVEQILKIELGAKRILWLHHGFVAGDDTDSHIDTLARFCSEDSIAYMKCKTQDDEHFAELSAMENEIRNLADANGNPYRLFPLPMPDPIHTDDGERLPATYANFLIINDAVLLPTYRQKQNDEQAIHQLQQAFPDREIIPIDCLPLIYQHGSLHCISMQIPHGVMNCKHSKRSAA